MIELRSAELEANARRAIRELTVRLFDRTVRSDENRFGLKTSQVSEQDVRELFDLLPPDIAWLGG